MIVTGAGNGLGRAHAIELAKRGATVVVNDPGLDTSGHGGSPTSADHVAAEIRSGGGHASAEYTSVATTAGCEALVAHALDRHGRLDAVVHNAGFTRNAPIPELTDRDHIEPVLAVHLRAGLALTRAAWPTFAAQRSGRFVYTSSGTGAWGRADGANYAAAKAGLIGLCNVAAIEGAPVGILANAILPVAWTRLAGAPDVTDASPEAAEQRAGSDPRMAPEWAAPLVALLVSSTWTDTRRFFSCALGRYAEVFVGVTDGWVAPGDSPPTAEDLADHLSTISDRARFRVPTSVFDEISGISRR